MAVDFDKIKKYKKYFVEDPRLLNPSESTKINNIYTKEKALKPTQKVDPDRVGVEEFIPFISDALDFTKIGEDINYKNYGQAALGAGLLLVPNAIEKPLKYLGKTIKQILRNKKISKPISNTLTDAEKAGIPKGERKSPSPYKQIGTATEPKSRMENFSVQSDLFGDFIDNGSQQTVFQNATDPSKVLKVYTERKFTSVPEIKEFHKQWMKRNRLPLQERINFEGYLQGDNRIFPVYSQNKIDILGNILPKEWTTLHLPKLNKEMHKLGYKGSGTYTNGKLTVGDISPFNVGYINGNLRLIDADVYRKGGKLLLYK